LGFLLLMKKLTWLYYSTIVRRSNAKKLIIIFYLILGTIGVLNMFSATVFSGFQRIQADEIDTLFNAYILEHGYRAFFDSDYKFPFFSPPFYYPQQEMLFESDNLLGTAPIYWVLRTFFDWTLSFQLWGIIQTVLTYVAFLILLLFLGINPVIAGLSSFVFSFGLPRISQLSHPQLFAQFYMSFALVFLFKYLKSLKHKDFHVFMLLWTLQFVAGFYLGWFFTLSLFIAFFLYGVFATENFKRIVIEVKSHKGFYLKSIILWGAVNGLFWIKYFINGGQYKMVTVFLHALEYLNNPQSYLTPAKGSLWAFIYPASKSITQENLIFPGAAFYLMGAITAFFFFIPFLKFRSKSDTDFIARFNTILGNGISADTLSIIRVSFLTGVILNLITTSFFDQSIWMIIALLIPGAEAIRYAARIWVVSHIWFYIAGGLTITYIIEKSTHINFKKLIVPVVVFVVLEQLVVSPVSIDKVALLQRISNAAGFLSDKQNTCNFAYFQSKEVTFTEEGPSDRVVNCGKNIEAMLTSLDSGIPSLNGYTAWIQYDLEKLYSAEDLTRLTKRPGETACIYNEDGIKEILVLPEISR